MTTASTMHAIGQIVRLEIEKLQVDVKVLDVKTTYGQVRCLVTPVSGIGQAWVDVRRLTKIQETV